ncbi:Imm27 family immunity protein [Echinicola sp. 20G]|uniref:Imm27 family immunity protein n=1 Tax=Echinicola sp. 20G TaxID=2781961 RepID=UPI001910E1B4|nr:Imm27 family immunity protein [Echinicola sp. 20G]
MEKEIIGKWVFKDGKTVADANCHLIESMIKNDLKEFENSEDGWTRRYKHANGSIWELTYPESHLHGGGPPKLSRIEK